MPLGNDDYDVVIGVSVADRTAAGSASSAKNVNKMTDDIRRYGDKQAREFSRTSRDLFNQTDQHVTRSASMVTRRLLHIFDTNNFLLRNMARQAGSTTGAIAIGVGKLALSYGRLGKDTEEASHRSRVALQDIKSAVGRLGTDPSAFPAALKATRDLSSAYVDMGKTGHAASIKAGNALEEAVHRRVVTLQSGLTKAQTQFEKFRIGASKDSDLLRNKINEISASVSQLLGGARIDAPFLKSFLKARTEADKYKLVLDQLGPKAAVAYASNQSAVEKLATAFARLEARASRSIRVQTDRVSEASIRVTKYRDELALLEKSLTGVAGQSGAAAVSTGAFSSSMVTGAVAAGAMLAIILAIIAAVGVFAFVTYKGASSAMKYGDEIYKLSLSTGLSVKTLSTLSVIARETNTDVDSLAKTFARTQIQIQRGLDKPFSEAGRALRTLSVNFKELRKANPDQQIFMLAKAYTELNNQNVRATVSQQLFSRDAERQAKMLEQIAKGFTIAQQKARKYGLEIDESGAVKSHAFKVAVTDLQLAWEGLWISLGIKILPNLTMLMEQFMEMVLKTGGAFEVLGGMANFALREIRIELQTIQDMAWWQFLTPGTLFGALAGGRSRSAAIIDQQDVDRMKEYNRRVEELRKRGIQGDDLYAPGKGPRSEMDRLEAQVKKLRFEIQALQDIGSRRFRLRFDLEELQKVKAGFESIFKLRNEMGLTMDEPVPQFRVFGSREEQQQDLANIQSYIKQMERMKSVFDGIRNVANEHSDALAELAKVQQEALMPVVDAGTLAEIKYHTAIRNRAKAEKELTADVIAETKLRKDAIQDEVGTTLKAYMSLQRDLGRSQDAIREQRMQDEMFLKILRGDLDTERDLRSGLQERMGTITPPVVPTELMTIAAHAATIDLNVAAIAEKIGAKVSNVVTTTIKTPGRDVDFAMSRLVRRNPDGTVTVLSEEDINPDIVKTQTTDVEFLRRRIFNESRERAGGERATAVRRANQEIIDNQMRMEQSLIDIDTDYLHHFGIQQIARRNEARETTISIMLLENDLRDLQNENSNFYKETWKNADEARLASLASIRTEIIGLQNEIANNGFDQSDREKLAYLQAIRDIQEASNLARESIIYNQVKISDSTVYHAEIANAKVIDFLANQRSITEVIADAKVGVIDTTFTAIDRGLDKFTSKLGIAGDLVKDLLSGFIRLALSPFFKSLYGSGGTNVGGIFGGGGGITGTGGTPPFAGFNLSNLLSGGGQGISTSPSITGLPPIGGLGGIAHTAIFGPGGNQRLSVGGFLRNLGPVLPFIGMSAGSQLGGGSRLGGLIGGAGGLLAGGIGAAFLTPSIFATTGVFGSMGPAIMGLLTNPFTAIAAGGLIIGALLLRRNSVRRQEETKRNEISNDTGTRIWALIDRARFEDITQSEADSEWNKIKSDYWSRISEIKDRKTRRHAELQWTNDFAPLKKILDQNVAESIERQNIRKRMSPVFSSGGWVYESDLIKVRPGEGIKYPWSNEVIPIKGEDKGYDSQFMYAPKGARIISKPEMSQSRGYQFGGTVGDFGVTELPTLEIEELGIDIHPDGLASIVVKSKHFKNAVIHNVRVGKKEKKLT